jgi:hypothetical protein
MRRNLAFFGLAVAAVVAGLMVAANGQSSITTYQPATLESGAYKPLTVWQTIALGSAYYTNPQRAQNINVAYTYDGDEFTAADKNQLIWDFAKSGKIAFGIGNPKSSGISVVDFATAQQKFNLNGPSDLPPFLAKAEVHLVTSDKMLLGSSAKATVVKTEASVAPAK